MASKKLANILSTRDLKGVLKMSDLLLKAKQEYEKVLIDGASAQVTELCDAMLEATNEYGKKMGIFPDVSDKSLSKSEAVAVALRRVFNSTEIKALAEAFGAVLGESVPVNTCGGYPSHSYLLATNKQWVALIPTVKLGSAKVEEVHLFKNYNGSREGMGSNGYLFSFNHYQDQVRLPSRTELLVFLLEFAANCPEKFESLRSDYGL